ncbi:hypothetical protein [Haliangium ochraceum]|uniref:Uncharacterized protein n=1 Tax=Haliangium ochraceum (strain DSM 14365 / JCM 11303 / SMP-2) TaxID=502025 RepID=D0LFR9_HALO1|nr:hypothetical protein [Haliangium ochraceum]ACY14521.1 conserved hypothetical protein [Haliangium ochraceum DSM 14365]
MSQPSRVLFETLASACAARGLDLACALPARAYNDAVAAAYHLPDFGRPDALAVVVGNTRALWPTLRRALRADPILGASPHPVDDFCAGALHAALAKLPAPPRHELRLASDLPPRRVAMQRLADIAGMAPLSPSYLNIHPEFGPWIALRGVVVFDLDAGDAPSPSPSPPAPSACERGCEAPCMPALQHALAQSRAEVTGIVDVAADWESWLAIRDACPIGRAHRYDDEQIRYHYTKDRRWLPHGD